MNFKLRIYQCLQELAGQKEPEEDLTLTNYAGGCAYTDPAQVQALLPP